MAVDLMKMGMPVMRMYLRKYTNIHEGDTECIKQMKSYGKDLGDKKLWAVYMEDASAKGNPGMLTANLIHLGNYDECLAIDVERNESQIQGQYCRTIISENQFTDTSSSLMFNKTELIEKFEIQNKEAEELMEHMKLYWDICIPAACSIEELQSIWNVLEKQEKVKFHMEFDEMTCSTLKSVSFIPLRDQIIIGCFTFIAALVVFSTFYDVLIFRRKKDSKLNIWIAFSFYTNGKKLLTIQKKSEQENITCLYGIRAISIMWVVLGHRYLLYYTGMALNSSYVFEWEKREENMLIVGAPASVDTFFTLSGFLVSYVIMQAVEKSINISLPIFYLHRFLRITPALAAMVAFTVGCLIHLGQGPFWYFIDQHIRGYCIDNWWTTLLFIQNYVHPSEQCIGQSWYLAVDTQLYCLSPLLFLPLIRWPKFTIGIILLLITASATSTFLISWYMVKSSPYLLIGKDFYKMIYVPTHTRVSPWLIGMIFGYWMSKKRNSKFNISKPMVLLLWFISLTIMGAVVFGNITFTKYDYQVIQSSSYNSFAKIGWSIAICWVIFACAKGYGGIVNTFLSLPLFTILSRLTYGIYLVHFMLLSLIAGQRRTTDYLQNLSSIHSFWGDYMFSVGLALIWTLTFESPIRALEDVLLKEYKAKQMKKFTHTMNQQINNTIILENKSSSNLVQTA